MDADIKFNKGILFIEAVQKSRKVIATDNAGGADFDDARHILSQSSQIFTEIRYFT